MLVSHSKNLNDMTLFTPFNATTLNIVYKMTHLRFTSKMERILILDGQMTMLGPAI